MVLHNKVYVHKLRGISSNQQDTAMNFKRNLCTYNKVCSKADKHLTYNKSLSTQLGMGLVKLLKQLPSQQVWFLLIGCEQPHLSDCIAIRIPKARREPYQYSTEQYSTVQYSTVQYSTVHYRTVQYRTIQYSTVPYRTVPYRTVPYITVQYSTVLTVRYSTVHNINSIAFYAKTQ